MTCERRRTNNVAASCAASLQIGVNKSSVTTLVLWCPRAAFICSSIQKALRQIVHMGSNTSRDENGSSRRLWNWTVEDETPRLIDGTAFTPSGAAASGVVGIADQARNLLALNCIKYSSFLGDTCLTGCTDGLIQRLNWRLKARAPDNGLNVWIPHSEAVTQVVIGAKLQMIYSCSLDTTVAITPITDKPASETATVLRGHRLCFASVAVDDAEQMLCSGGRDTQTIFWDLTTSYIAAKTTTPEKVVTCSTWSPGEALGA
uniref:Uncharacterized protein n=1 Tax=Hyaloperonospora arabidopsidis (strain Emoy2) TaxID=559515 RepID=M4C007_HYAAE